MLRYPLALVMFLSALFTLSFFGSYNIAPEWTGRIWIRSSGWLLFLAFLMFIIGWIGAVHAFWSRPAPRSGRAIYLVAAAVLLFAWAFRSFLHGAASWDFIRGDFLFGALSVGPVGIAVWLLRLAWELLFQEQRDGKQLANG